MSSQSLIPSAPPPLPADAHKGMAGRVFCLCGSEEMPGAALLCVRSAYRAGAGLVSLACFTRATIQVVAGAVPETIFVDLTRASHEMLAHQWDELAHQRHDSLVVGPGLGTSERARSLVRALLSDTCPSPLVLDADGLNALGPRPESLRARKAQGVITPHPGEAARLLGRPVPSDDLGRLACAVELARRSGTVCVLKGRATVVSDGERSYVNSTGNPGMATAGSGDVLAGILGAYLAAAQAQAPSGFGVWEATLAAVYVHGLAGDLAREQRGERGLIASDLIEHLPQAQIQHERDGGSA